MTAGASPTLARYAGFAAFGALPVLFLTLTLVNLVYTNEVRLQIARQESTLGAMSTHLPALGLRDAGDSRSLYLSESTPSLAAADLRRRIAAAVVAAGGRLIETRFVDADQPEPRPDLFSLGATFDIGNAGLAKLLKGVETGLPVIHVRTLSLRHAGSSETTAQEDPLLRADMVVEAFRRSDSR